MITLLCSDLPDLQTFEADMVCPTRDCPDPNCTGKGNPSGQCVLRATAQTVEIQGETLPAVQCLGAFPQCIAYTFCECTVTGCEHVQPLVDQLQQMTLPPEERRQSARTETLRTLARALVRRGAAGQ
jgi:hypothetical protein